MNLTSTRIVEQFTKLGQFRTTPNVSVSKKNEAFSLSLCYINNNGISKPEPCPTSHMIKCTDQLGSTVVMFDVRWQ